MNHILFRAVLAISSAIAALGPLYAAKPTDGEPLANWVQQVDQKIDKAMTAPSGNNWGAVRVDFRLSPQGVPTEVIIAATNPDLFHAAQETLVRVGSFPPLPAGYDPHQRISMQLLFSNYNERAYFRQRSAMLASASRSNTNMAIDQTVTKMALAHLPN